ncbi:MAG: response regulator, partial [Saprospiraceae bacterium]|nr:response regulator [Saprospiraceae bacterium]
LLSENFDVVCVDNPILALQWMDNNPNPILILSDLAMPEMDGFELLSNLKGSAFFREIPIIILSGLSDSKDRIRCLELGANDFIAKPFNPDELLLKANRLIANS